MNKMIRYLLIATFLWNTGIKSFAQDPLRFKSEIEDFKKSDKISMPPSGCVLFVGSSSIRFWESLESDFPDYCVINRGFGGSELGDVNFFFNDVVKPYSPQIVILYAGDNDLADGKEPAAVLEELKKFMDNISRLSNDLPVLYISAKPSPSRWGLKDQYEKFNALAGEYCSNAHNVYFIDIFNPMLGENGRPIPELYRQDSLHMTGKGYEIWKSMINPYLEKLQVHKKTGEN